MNEKKIRVPDFFIIGAPRCGTTALCAYLGHHPTIFICEPKEPNYFAPDLTPQGMTWHEYTDLFRDASYDATVGEASTCYLFSDVAIENIVKVRPDAKMIAMLRNPIDAAYSAHGAALLSYDEDIADFATAWQLGKARSRGLNLPERCRKPKQVVYRSLYGYADQLERVFSHVAPSGVHIIIFEEFFSDPTDGYADVLRFLGVKQTEYDNFAVVGSHKRHRAGLLESGIRWITKRKRKGSMALETAEVWAKGLLGNERWRRIRKVAVRKTRERGERQRLDPRVRQDMMDEVDDDIRRLESLLNRDLSLWRRGECVGPRNEIR